ncbi:MAG TPA: hypothetical protein VFH27_10330, partial [Longimicrobiaceae bacterium]|nr:hypothetical protein [Longimicrobiaceae bacterium]
QALGISAAAGTSGGAALTAEEASLVRRGAQTLVGRYRQDIGVSMAGTLGSTRSYRPADMELWFALSAFADNASLYEQLARATGNAQGAEAAGTALAAGARRVDAAMQAAGASQQVQSAWMSIRSQLTRLDQSYR